MLERHGAPHIPTKEALVRVTVLGGAAACPGPGQDCSAYLVEQGGTRLLLDCGPNTLSTLRQYVDFTTLDAILISHLHSDHLLDLVPFRYGLRYGPGGSGRTIPLWMPPGGRAFLEQLAGVFGSGETPPEEFFATAFHIEEYDPDRMYEFGGITVRFQATKHSIPCWAMRLEAAGRSLVYLADTSHADALVRFSANADLMICEGTFPDPDDAEAALVTGHMTAGQAGALAAAAGARHLLLTHLWPEIDPERYRVQAATTFGGPLDLAKPGLVFAL